MVFGPALVVAVRLEPESRSGRQRRGRVLDDDVDRARVTYAIGKSPSGGQRVTFHVPDGAELRGNQTSPVSSGC